MRAREHSGAQDARPESICNLSGALQCDLNRGAGQNCRFGEEREGENMPRERNIVLEVAPPALLVVDVALVKKLQSMQGASPVRFMVRKCIGV